MHDAVEAGKRIGAIFKEPTITPTKEQMEEFGLTQPLGSPNGAMRKGWNGITISRDTIHIEVSCDITDWKGELSAKQPAECGEQPVDRMWNCC